MYGEQWGNGLKLWNPCMRTNVSILSYKNNSQISLKSNQTIFTKRVPNVALDMLTATRLCGHDRKLFDENILGNV